MPFKQLVLLVVDGFGAASAHPGNSITEAAPRNLNYLINNYPAVTLQASGPSVGLRWGERGNSEVGHLNLGSGRIVSQDLPRISQAIASGRFYENPAFLRAVEHVKKNNSSLHLAGLISPGAVHSLEEHVYALLALAADQNVSKIFIHMFTDGRDTPEKAALKSLDKLNRKMLEAGVGKIATLTGRFFAMDRGGHWEVTQRTYQAMTRGVGERAENPREAVQNYYSQQIYDETIPPTVMTENDIPVGLVKEGDSVVFFNFRPDRAVQLVRAFTDPSFDKFSKKFPFLQNMYYAAMTEYADNLPVSVAFPPQEIKNGVSEVISQNKLNQFHIAESEKYAHVTSFFNGGREAPWPREDREIITSPASYEKRYEDVPEMSVDKLSRKVIARLESGTSFILANFANFDMVGHTASKPACLKAVAAVDKNLGEIYKSVIKQKACFVITSDHGNIEEILEPRSGRIDKGHSANPVPLILCGKGLERDKVKSKGYLELASSVPDGVLSDVGPTVLDLLGIAKPKEMSAISLLPKLLKQTYAKSLEAQTEE